MEIARESCIGCADCIPYCVIGAITMEEGTASIDQDRCVECGSCLRNVPCPTEAFRQPPLSWPRVIRQWFSDNLVAMPNHATMGAGRGVIEVKTNDRTNYYKPGEVGFFIEMGRPGVSSSMRDIEKMLQAFARKGYQLVTYNSLAPLIADWKAGKLKDDVLGEAVLSATLEFRANLADVPEIVSLLRDVGGQVDTVFSVGAMCCIDPPYTIPLMPILSDLAVHVRPNAKINVGLGKPISKG